MQNLGKKIRLSCTMVSAKRLDALGINKHHFDALNRILHLQPSARAGLSLGRYKNSYQIPPRMVNPKALANYLTKGYRNKQRMYQPRNVKRSNESTGSKCPKSSKGSKGSKGVRGPTGPIPVGLGGKLRAYHQYH